MKYGLNEDTIKTINRVFENNSVVDKVVLYGSRAKGNYKNGSDVDLTLFGNMLDFNTLLKISSEIDDLPLPYKFDISIFNSITNKDLIEHIARVGKVFYSKRKSC